MKKNSMKILGICLLVLTAVTVILTMLVVGKMTHSTNAEDTSWEESFSGTLQNAYLYENQDDAILIYYQGKKYIAHEKAASNYTGVADIEITNGHITRICAKGEYIEGRLDAYSKHEIQINGYEPLEYDGELPVYLFAGTQMTRQPIRQKKLEDLVVGTSKIRLVVADKKACAVIQNGEDAMEKIRVLMKNQTKLTYKNIYISSDDDFVADGNPVTAGQPVSAKKLLENKKTGESVCVEPGERRLYLLEKNGEKKGIEFEGVFWVRKEKPGYILINELPVEEYVRYVLPSEMPTHFSYEALKAQAVCARTFAYQQMKSTEYAKYGANLDNTTSYQVYHASKTYEVTDQAVYDTQGMVLTEDEKLISCYYYSTSPGYSENLEVWDSDSPDYLVAENHTKEKQRDLSKKKAFHKFISKSVPSYDVASPYYRWKAELSTKMAMDGKYGSLKKLEVKRRSKSGYILELRAVFEDGERSYTKENEIRYFLGEYLTKLVLSDGSNKTGLSALPSACFEIASQKKGKIVLRGGGFGHGIGMSQYGADAMGEEGKNWQEILKTYYKDTDIMNIFDVKNISN